jgi:hypothetical protein
MKKADSEPGMMISKKPRQLEYALTGQGLGEDGALGRGR